jgi:hypothetical protein
MEFEGRGRSKDVAEPAKVVTKWADSPFAEMAATLNGRLSTRLYKLLLRCYSGKASGFGFGKAVGCAACTLQVRDAGLPGTEIGCRAAVLW